MSEIDPLLYDLALILLIAGLVTIIFKALKQPPVLGYIVAGMLTGPYITFVPTVQNIQSVEFWGKIGVIFLLFGLGLEFSFKKIKKVGGAGFMTVFTEAVMMFCMGFLLGSILEWSWMASLFLGGMLAVSSTSIIIKAFDDLGLKNKKFTQLVFGTLVVEDLLAVLLLVLFPALVIGKSFDGGELFGKVMNLSLFLLLWFTGGIFLIPSVFKKLRKFLGNETLIVVSLGLCLMMVVVTVKAGISEAMGAFVMGSILSGTLQSEKIIKLTRPIKDFFGAIFFVSVGMLVDPMVAVKFWPQILLISVTVILAKPLSATIGLLFSGQTLKIAMQSGMCLCQIGEFSFIIAALGKQLGVVPDYIYPIIVTVSILTTFITPYWIKLGEPAYNLVYDHVKPQWKIVIERLGTGRKTLDREMDWHKLLKSYFLRLFIYTGWIFFVCIFFVQLVQPFFMGHFGHSFYSRLALFLLNVLVMMPFMYGLLKRKDSDGIFDKIWSDKKFARGPLLFMMMFKYWLALIAVAVISSYYITQSSGAILLICALVIVTVAGSAKIKKYYGKIEGRFLSNLNSEGGNRTGIVLPRELAEEIHIESCEVGANSFLSGKSISQVHRAKKTGALVVRITRGTEVIDLPSKNEILFPADSLMLLGTDQQVQEMMQLAEDVQTKNIPEPNADVELFQLTLSENSVLVGHAAHLSDIRNNFGVLLVGVEKSHGNTYIRPSSAIILEAGDTVWAVGSKEKVKTLK